MGKIVLITGCSKGIGRDLAGRLSGAGYTVVATARNVDTIADVPAATRLALDVTRPESIENAVNATIKEYGRIDVLVNNAGLTTFGAIEELAESEIHRMVDVNILGTLDMVRAVVPFMRKQGSGMIVNLSSIAGKTPVPINAVYSATKHAVEAISDGLRHELAAFGIRVVIIEPGAIKTEFAAGGISRAGKTWTDKDSPYYELYRRDEAFSERMRKTEGDPSDVSAVIQKAIEAGKPKARYTANIGASAKLVMMLGDKVWNRVVKMMYGT